MNTGDSTGYLSIIAMNIIHPIERLISELLSLEPVDPNEVQASPIDNGYSISIIVLTIMMVESYVRRAQYILGYEEIRIPVEFVRKAFPDYEDADELGELFVVRDVVVHNHVWEAQIEWDDTLGMKLIMTEMKIGGDKKFDRVIDLKKRKTKRLGINLFPTRVYRADAAIVLRHSLRFLLYLENKDRNLVYMSHLFVMTESGSINFVDLVNRFCDETL